MTEWRKAGESPRPMMARAAAEIQPLAQVVGDIPDEHVITVAERCVSVDYPTIVQNNMNTDTVDLVLDGEWNGMSVVCYIGHPGDLGEFEWEGTPFTLPVYDTTGSIDVTVVGLSADGKTRLVTVEAKGVMNVIKSGEFEGSVPPEEQPDLLGQILAAKDDAEDAAQTATTAASAANSAASSANSAASSANSAATSANSAATKANSAAVDAQNAYDTLQPYMATIDSCANILHREVGPDSVVTADDSFPCKPVEMTVYGNTTQNLWVNPSGTAYGVTVKENSDGSVTLSGTATSGNHILSKTFYSLKPNTTYTLSISASVGIGYSFQVRAIDSDGEAIANHVAVVGGTTFTTPSNTVSGSCLLFMNASAPDYAVSGTYRVMLNEGSEPEPWCPPGLNSVGDDGNVDIVTAGKNLLDIPDTQTIEGYGGPYTFTMDDDGWVSCSKDSDQRAWGYETANVKTMLSAGSYTVSIQFSEASSRQRLEVYAADGTRVCYIQGGSSTASQSFALDAATEVGVMYKLAGKRARVQLELGSTATDYEPPNIATTPIDLQGHTLNALPDGTRDELHIDGGGNVVLEKRTWSDVFDGTEGWGDSINRYGLVNALTYETDVGIDNVAQRSIADKLPVIPVIGGHTGIRGYSGLPTWVDAFITSMPGDLTGFKAWLGNNNTTLIYPLAEPQTIDLGTITPPTMAAPNVTAYVADDTPAEMGLDYVRDVNIVHERLEERVAALELASATA